MKDEVAMMEIQAYPVCLVLQVCQERRVSPVLLDPEASRVCQVCLVLQVSRETVVWMVHLDIQEILV